MISKISGRGRLDPKKSNVIFAVPNERHLRNIDNVMGRIIPPGKIGDSFNLLKGEKCHINGRLKMSVQKIRQENKWRCKFMGF